MVGAISVLLGGYEVVAWAHGWRTVSRQRGLLRAAVFGWWVVLGAHLVYEAVADDVARGAAKW